MRRPTEPDGATTSPSRCGCAGRSASGCSRPGVAPYPVTVERTHTLARGPARRTTRRSSSPTPAPASEVAVTGRVIFLRNTGKLCFARLREGDGTELQVMLSLADVGEESLADFKALVDLGDLLAVRGEVVTSRRGELSVQATDVGDGRQDAAPAAQRAQAALRRGAHPAALRRHDGAPRGARDGAHQGGGAARACARTLDERGFVEVETPILQLTNGGAAARPFRTHLNALDQDMLLRIALELDLKKAMIGGVDKVYEIGRTFRNEGLDSTHAAEFSMLEAYEAYGDQFTMMELTRSLVARRRAGRRPHRRHRRATAARSTSRASGARPRSSTWSPRRSARRSPSTPTRRRCASYADDARRRAAAGGGARDRRRALRAARRGHADQADLRDGARRRACRRSRAASPRRCPRRRSRRRPRRPARGSAPGATRRRGR